MKRTYWRSLWAHRLNLLRKSLTMRTAILLLTCLTVGCSDRPTEPKVEPSAYARLPLWTDIDVFVVPIDGHEYVVADGIESAAVCHHFGCPCLERGLTPEAEYTR
jgi:hypothetical protein